MSSIFYSTRVKHRISHTRCFWKHLTTHLSHSACRDCSTQWGSLHPVTVGTAQLARNYCSVNASTLDRPGPYLAGAHQGRWALPSGLAFELGRCLPVKKSTFVRPHSSWLLTFGFRDNASLRGLMRNVGTSSGQCMKTKVIVLFVRSFGKVQCDRDPKPVKVNSLEHF